MNPPIIKLELPKTAGPTKQNVSQAKKTGLKLDVKNLPDVKRYAYVRYLEQQRS